MLYHRPPFVRALYVTRFTIMVTIMSSKFDLIIKAQSFLFLSYSELHSAVFIPESAKCMIVMFSGSYIEKITNRDGIFYVKASKSNTNLVFFAYFCAG